jgi:3-isopropylmalate dehydratase small subunit
LTLQEGESVSFPRDPFAKKCFLEDIDELGYLLSLSDKISEYEAKS